MIIRRGYITTILGLLFLLFLLPIRTTTSDMVQNNIPIYMERGNLFAAFFKEPVEIMIFITNDGKFYKFTNFISVAVFIIYEDFEDILEKDGLATKDIFLVIHNHTEPMFRFSLEDRKFYSFLQSKGFDGLFLLWSDLRQEVVDRLPKEKD